MLGLQQNIQSHSVRQRAFQKRKEIRGRVPHWRYAEHLPQHHHYAMGHVYIPLERYWYCGTEQHALALRGSDKGGQVTEYRHYATQVAPVIYEYVHHSATRLLQQQPDFVAKQQTKDKAIHHQKRKNKSRITEHLRSESGMCFI